MNEYIEPDDAARALAEVRRRKEQVTVLSQIPGWFRWAVGLLTVAMALGLDSGEPRLIGLGVTIFVIGLLTAIAVVIGRSWSRAIPRRDLLGPRGALVIVAFVALVLLVNLSTAVILEAAGSPVAATVGALAGAVVLIGAGPVVARYLHRLVNDTDQR
jgi:hypothetical protein